MKKMTLTDRKILSELLKENQPYREIGKVIGKSSSSISDELKRNSLFGKYDAFIAHRKAQEREKERGKRTKIEISPGLKKYILQKIEEDWSPEQISNNLKILAGKNVISHETMYQFVYSAEGKKLKLYTHLRHKKEPRRRSFGTRQTRIKIPERVPIHFRSEAINKRIEFGHWEGDLMIFPQQRQVLAVFVERMTRRTVAIINPDKTALSMEMAMHEFISRVGQVNVKSLTLDNGTENVRHINIVHDYAETIQTFFCDPYCSWQKGTVENTNKLLRQYFPRTIDSRFLNQDFADKVVLRLNNRPRKCISFNTPLHYFSLCSV